MGTEAWVRAGRAYKRHSSSMSTQNNQDHSTMSPNNSNTTTTASNDSVDNFTNDSAMMIAYERHLETCRPDAMFSDPFAHALAGSKGETLSDGFGAGCVHFGFAEWPEFHKTWTAVRTKFIDDHLAALTRSGEITQLCNCGAGMDTRAYRLECYKAFSNGSFEVGMEVINANKSQVFELLGGPTPHCSAVHNVSLDFLNEEKTLATELAATPFEAEKPTVFLSEGLVMYLGPVGKLKLLRDVSAVAAVGSILILQFMAPDPPSEAVKANPTLLEHALSVEEATGTLSEHGWGEFQFSKFGEEQCSFGRFPVDRFKPSGAFSFVVCTKLK